MIEKYIKEEITRTDLEKWVMSRTLEHEYDKPISGKPFQINAKSKLMLVEDYERLKEITKNQTESQWV